MSRKTNGQILAIKGMVFELYFSDATEEEELAILQRIDSLLSELRDQIEKETNDPVNPREHKQPERNWKRVTGFQQAEITG